MKKRICIAFLLIFCLTSSRVPVTQTVILENPVRVVTSSDRRIFPKCWLSTDINARAEALQESEIERSRIILSRVMEKYPAEVLARNIEVVYVLHRLTYKGISAGGTNSCRNIYIVNRGSCEGYTEKWIERTFHAEFSSILLRNYPQYLDREAWEQANAGSFNYGVSGVQCVKQKQARKVFDPSLHRDGFLYQYARSTFENDFNSIAAQLFLGDDRFWSLVDRFPAIKEKTELAITFYHRIDHKFSRSFFLSLAGIDSSEHSAAAGDGESQKLINTALPSRSY